MHSESLYMYPGGVPPLEDPPRVHDVRRDGCSRGAHAEPDAEGARERRHEQPTVEQSPDAARLCEHLRACGGGREAGQKPLRPHEPRAHPRRAEGPEPVHDGPHRRADHGHDEQPVHDADPAVPLYRDARRQVQMERVVVRRGAGVAGA
eukprot:1545658-Rhodomonas_salina.1